MTTIRGRATRILLSAIFLFASSVATAQPVRPVYREIGDWLLACDNVRDCVARQVPGSGDSANQDAGLEIVRKAGPSGLLTVRVTADAPLDPSAIAIPGRTTPGWRRDRSGEEAILSSEAARRFVRDAANAPALRLGASDLSLKGLAAVLLAMDAAQGRVGNASALIRPGRRPASVTPVAPRLPLVRPGLAAPPLAKAGSLAAAVRRLNAPLLKTHDCDIAPDALDVAYPLTRTDALVLVGCGRFAYQSSVLAFRVPRERPARAVPLRLPEPRAAAGMAAPGGATTMDEYIEGAYDPATRVFSEYSKGRGIADCGSSTEWTFDGTRFRLSAFRWQDRCAGGRPGNWPTLYRTRR